MNPQSSATHDALVALVASTKTTLPTVQVLDGPGVEDLENDTVVIGVGDPAVITTRTPPDYGGRCTETGEIVCVISCWDGDTNVASKRARVYTILADIEEMLRADPTLGGAVDDSTFGDTGELIQRQQNGALAALGFSVRYEAHI